QGTQRDAKLYSVGANDKHGLRRSNEDKRNAVLTLLNDTEWSKWSDNQIAKACGVAHSFVGRVRSSLVSESSEKPQDRTYTTKHGTEAVMNTASIGKKKQEAAPTPAQPTAPIIPQAAANEPERDGPSDE